MIHYLGWQAARDFGATCPKWASSRTWAFPDRLNLSSVTQMTSSHSASSATIGFHAYRTYRCTPDSRARQAKPRYRIIARGKAAWTPAEDSGYGSSRREWP